MKICVCENLNAKKPLEQSLKELKAVGIEAVEIGCGGYPGNDHAHADILLNDDKAFAEWIDTFKRCDMILAALSVHGNCVHPDKEVAASFEKDFRNAVLLAEKAGLDTIITFSGCPGDHPGAKYPNWVTCPWPDDFLKILDYQWNEVLIPYWKEAAAFAESHGVTKIALEMHPGANFDPSHLVWQGMEPAAAIRMLAGAIYHVHAKDTKVDAINTARIGVLDTKHYGDEINRAWVFRALGYGHDAAWWKDLVSNLRLVGYDGVLSIEHEDSLMTTDEGLRKAVAVLKEAIMKEPKPSTMSWA